MKKSLQLLLSGLALVACAPHGASSLGDEFNTENEHPDTHWTYIDNGKNWPGKSAVSVKDNKCGIGKN